jgi:hypothetical protein
MQNELSNLSAKSEIKLNTEIKKVWKLFLKPSHLELFHPFCKSNKIISWNEQNKIDELTYLSGLVYERTIYSWEKNKGFKLYIGKKKGKKSKVEWKLKSINKMTILTIKVNPYISDKFSLTIYNILLRYYIIPSLNRYLDSVTKGIKFYLENGKIIEHNQFGSHKWFS